MTFREDGAAALEWAARYLEQVGEFPVLAQVEPGDIRSRLPSAPPERGEPFADVLRDLDEILLPGTTHWQSPRFFAYFANSAAEPRADSLVVNAHKWQFHLPETASPGKQRSGMPPDASSDAHRLARRARRWRTRSTTAGS